jgi:prepilin-type processing-associated H-X9-DG protein
MTWWGSDGQDGVIVNHRGGKITFASISDGTSNTLLVGEKFTQPRFYTASDPWNAQDSRGFLGGAWMSDRRSTGSQTQITDLVVQNPARDQNLVHLANGDEWHANFFFGSAHPAGLNAVFADGSVHSIKYGIDGDVFNALGNRRDGTNLNNDPDNIN